MCKGLYTWLKPIFGEGGSNQGSEYVEGFLAALERTLLEEDFQWKYSKTNNKTRDIQYIFHNLKKSDFVSVPTNFNNSMRFIPGGD